MVGIVVAKGTTQMGFEEIVTMSESFMEIIE